MLGDDIHTHKREPRDQNTTVKRDDLRLQKRLVGEQIHADNAYNEKRYHRRRDTSEQNRRFLFFFLDPFFYVEHCLIYSVFMKYNVYLIVVYHKQKLLAIKKRNFTKVLPTHSSSFRRKTHKRYNSVLLPLYADHRTRSPMDRFHA